MKGRNGFQMLERSHSRGGVGVVAGYVDQAGEDTVLLMPSERVKLLSRTSRNQTRE